MRKQLHSLPADKRARARGEIFEQLLEREVDRRLISRQARALKIQVTPAEIETALLAVAKQNGIDKQTLLASVQKEGLTVATYRAELKQQLLEAKLLRIQASRFDAENGSKNSQPDDDDQVAALQRLLKVRTRWMQELRKGSRVVIRVRR
ncbi:MAG TPA: SurA N-terminal domain-containing protein [Polyangiaceae bacterium]|nr:SurA N-terminal domain-containing protein [Polyangiaceae bacterium]